MRVTYHARMRFALHINAVDDPVHGVCKMWHTGREATESDLRIFKVDRRTDSEYRLGHYDSNSAILAARCGHIVTLIPAFRLIRK